MSSRMRYNFMHYTAFSLRQRVRRLVEDNRSLAKISHRFIQTNGIRMHIAEQGTGPLVVLLHGFPLCWYSWRHQIPALADAGYHAVAPDLRGYGQTDVPLEAHRYTALDVAGDIVGLIEALDYTQVILVGHDWGRAVATWVSQFRPDLVQLLVVSQIPVRDPKCSSLHKMRAAFGENVYMLQFQIPGKAEAEFAKYGSKSALLKLLGYNHVWADAAKEGRGILESLEIPDPLPSWITDEQIDYYAEQFNRTGWTGALNYYRNIERSWELMAPWSGRGVSVPCVLLMDDGGILWTSDFDSLKTQNPELLEVIRIPNSGHFVHEENPLDYTDHLLSIFGRCMSSSIIRQLC